MRLQTISDCLHVKKVFSSIECRKADCILRPCTCTGYTPHSASRTNASPRYSSVSYAKTYDDRDTVAMAQQDGACVDQKSCCPPCFSDEMRSPAKRGQVYETHVPIAVGHCWFNADLVLELGLYSTLSGSTYLGRAPSSPPFAQWSAWPQTRSARGPRRSSSSAAPPAHNRTPSGTG